MLNLWRSVGQKLSLFIRLYLSRCVATSLYATIYGKHVPAATNMHETIKERCFLCGRCREFITRTAGKIKVG